MVGLIQCSTVIGLIQGITVVGLIQCSTVVGLIQGSTVVGLIQCSTVVGLLQCSTVVDLIQCNMVVGLFLPLKFQRHFLTKRLLNCHVYWDTLFLPVSKTVFYKP